ncbi:hypothetical protein BGZ99_003706, partial [Dissophora globulifera]
MSFPGLLPSTDIRFNLDLAGGSLMDCGCYTVNSIRYFSGLEVASVEKAVPKILSDNIDGRMEATLNLTSGAKAELTASLTNPLLSLKTYREFIPYFMAETDDKIFTFGVFFMPSLYHYVTVKDKATGKTENLPKLYEDGYTTYHYQLEAFVTAVKSGGKDTKSIAGWVTGED